jgi:sterol desaturase/sphingolipid hydroxylase (fatty acid hydroxylase superfamily)
VTPGPAEARLSQASAWYLGALIGGFTLMALWETWRPLRPGGESRLGRRWTINLALLAINQGAVHAALPVLGLAAAQLAASQGWGLWPRLNLPAWLGFGLALLVLDALRWLLHRAFHQVPLLWRLHRVHHSDLDYDCTIGLRFHPVEAVLTQGALVAVVLLLGLPPLAVMVSDVLTIALGYFAHANIGLPARADAWLRRVIVTPDVHRIHHSARVDESMSNFGSILTWWDRLAGCFRPRPEGGALGMQIGLTQFPGPRPLGLWRLLVLPLRE